MSQKSVSPSFPPFGSVLVYTGEDTVGDGLVKLPFVRDLRRRFPDARITWCAGIGPCSYAHVLAPLVDGLIDEVIENPGLGRHAWQALGLIRPMKRRYFDLIIDTQRAIVRSLALRHVRHDVFLSSAADFRFSTRRPSGKEPRPRHLIGQLRGLLDLAVAKPANTALPGLSLPDGLRGLAGDILPAGPVYVGLSPGAGDRSKCWPLSGFIKIAQAQVEAGRQPVFFLGPQESGWVAEIHDAVPEALFPESDDRITGEGVRGPLMAIALAERLAAAVANDSGTGHMLAAGGTPLVSLFSKHDPAKYAPCAERLAIIDSKDFGGTDPALIPVQAVGDALDHMLAGGISYRAV